MRCAALTRAVALRRCELAEGGPYDQLTTLMYAPNTTDFAALGLGTEFISLYDSSASQRATLGPEDMKMRVRLRHALWRTRHHDERSPCKANHFCEYSC